MHTVVICYYTHVLASSIPYCLFLLLCRPSRSCTPLPQVPTYTVYLGGCSSSHCFPCIQVQTTIQEQPLTTPTHSLLHGSSSLRVAGNQSGFLANSLDSLSHSSFTSQLSTPCDTRIRQATSNAKVPTESSSRLHIHDRGDIQHTDQQAPKTCNTRTCSDSMVHEGEHSMLDSQKQSYNTSGFDDYKSDDCLLHKGSRSSSRSVEVRSARKRDVYSYPSSEEDGSSIFNANIKPKVPQKKKKMERALPKKHSVPNSVDDSIPHEGGTLRSKRTTTYRKEAGNKRQSTPVLRSKVALRYPGYSSGWSSSDSETNKDNIVSTLTTSGGEKDKPDDQFSAPSSINSTISTSSWTSSERENKNDQVQNNIVDKPLESGHIVDSQLLESDNNHHSDSGGIDFNNVEEPESPANVVSSLGGQESLPSGSEGNDSPNYGVEDNPDIHESTPLAPDSVDLEMEPQIQSNASESQHLEGPVALQLEVTIIPETQETLTDGTSTETVVDCLGSPVIPLQNGCPDQLSPLPVENDQQYSKPVDILAVNSIKTKNSGALHVQPSFSDMDSYVLQSVASDTSEDQGKKHIRTKLLGKARKHTRYMHMHSDADVGDSSSTTESGGTHSSVRRRKAKVISRMFGTCHLKNHPYRRALSRANLESYIGVPRSDSEFVRPSPRSASLSCRRRKGLKLRKKRNSAAPKAESDDQKNQQKEVTMDEQQSKLSEDKPLVQVKTKQKPTEFDSGVSSTNISEIAQSSSTSDAQHNLERYSMTKKSKSKKRISREVIRISSDSESIEFEPPPFKKRKPRPNFSQQRKQKPSLVDEVYSSAEAISSQNLNVDDLGTTTCTAEKQSTSLCTPKIDCDLEIPRVSIQQPLTDEQKHLKSSHVEEETTDEPTLRTMQHNIINIGQMNYSEVDDSNRHFTIISTAAQKLQSTTEKVSINKKSKLNNGDKSDSSDSSDSDRDEEMKCSDGVELSAKREIDNDIMLQKLESSKDKRRASVDKLPVADFSASSDSDGSSDETTFQGTLGKAASTHNPPDKGSELVEDGPPSFCSEQNVALSKMKGAASPEQQSMHRVVPLSNVDSPLDKSKQGSSESDDNTNVQRTAILTQQPVGGDTKDADRSVRSSPKKSSPQKNSKSYTSSIRRPPRFLFSKSTMKKNYSQQLSELKNPTSKAQGCSDSENSTGKINSE